jgi:hypothetical protein
MIVALAARDNLAFRNRPVPSLARLVEQTVAMTAPALRAAADYARVHQGG